MFLTFLEKNKAKGLNKNRHYLVKMAKITKFEAKAAKSAGCIHFKKV